MILRVDSSAFKKYTKQLERISKSALPVVVRQTLNSAAFDVKTKTMPASAKESFVERSKNFLKATSKVEQAKGFNISTMKSTVGFKKTSGQGIDKAVEDLEQQESGGVIGGRSFIAHDKARVSSSRNKNVRPGNRTTAIKSPINARKVSSNNIKQRYIRAAFMAKKLNGDSAFVLGNPGRGGQTLWKIGTISSNRRGKLKIKKTALYSYRKGRKVKIKATHFMKSASQESGSKMNTIYIKHAQAQFRKYYKI